MQTQIVKMINDFEHGRLSRRQLIAYLTGMFAASLGATIAFYALLSLAPTIVIAVA